MNIIETHNLTKYYGKSRGMIDVNLEVKEGEIFGFIGPNGAGKSTMIRTLLGLIFPTRGSGRIFNQDIIKKNREIKRHIGYMPSEINYYDKMSVLELLDYSARFYNLDCSERIRELAELFKLDLARNISDLSMGNKKKVAIVQSLIHAPRLLILDEPTSGLDPLMQAEFFQVLKQENQKGVTIFFSSHVLNEVQRFCERVAIIREGEIINIEDIDTLRKKQMKKININTFQKIDKVEFHFRGISFLKMERENISFYYTGEINVLLKHLVNINLNSLTIHEPTLDEIFLHYYKGH